MLLLYIYILLDFIKLHLTFLNLKVSPGVQHVSLQFVRGAGKK